MDAAKERPWADHPLYRGMTDEAAGPSWRAMQKRLAEEASAPPENWPSPNGPEDYGLPADAGRDDVGEADGEQNAFTFDLAPYAFPDPALIPPREWLFGRHYIRGAVSATIGAPGRLKSTVVLTEIVGMVVGRDLMTGEALASGPLRAAYLNGEEIQDELDRRVAPVLSLGLVRIRNIDHQRQRFASSFPDRRLYFAQRSLIPAERDDSRRL